jgi:hypothetical protein
MVDFDHREPDVKEYRRKDDRWSVFSWAFQGKNGSPCFLVGYCDAERGFLAWKIGA